MTIPEMIDYIEENGLRLLTLDIVLSLVMHMTSKILTESLFLRT